MKTYPFPWRVVGEDVVDANGTRIGECEWLLEAVDQHDALSAFKARIDIAIERVDHELTEIASLR